MQKRVLTAVGPCALAVVTVLSTCGVSSAVTTVQAYDTLSAANPFNQPLASFGLVNGTDGDRALLFTPAQTIRLTKIDLALARVLIGQGSGPATVQLCLDANNAPGAVMESWTTSNIQSTAGQVESMTSSLGTTVAAGNKYWITIARAPGSNLGAGWFMSASSSSGSASIASKYVGDPWTVSTYPRPTATRVTGVAEIPGDASEDGRITFDDYALLDRGIAKRLTGWNNGDFNGDNVVNRQDYLILDAAYIQSRGALSSAELAAREAKFGNGYATDLAALVPEPGGAAVLLGGSALVAGRRRRAAR